MRKIIFLFLTFAVALSFTYAQQYTKGPVSDDDWKPITLNPDGTTAIFLDDMNGDNTVAGLEARGWVVLNEDGGGLTAPFYQGVASVFAAYEGPDTGYVAANFNGGNAQGVIDQWLISPEVTVAAGDTLSFWHRSPDGSIWPDSMYVRYSTTAGITPGDFDQTWGRYEFPLGWTRWTGTFNYTGTIRFAIQYYIADNATNSNYIGLDYIEVESAGGPTAAFMDDFEAGSSNWNIINNGGDCDWLWDTLATHPFPIGPSPPPNMTGQIMVANSDLCGFGFTMNTDLILDIPLDLTGWQTVMLEYDSDYQNITGIDSGTVYVSADGGATWDQVFQYLSDTPAEHAVHDISSYVALSNSVLLRFHYWAEYSWYWVIDNVAVYVDDFIPVELTSFTASVNENNVTLNWSTASETNNLGFEIERNSGNDFQTIGFVNGNGTTTEAQQYSFADVVTPGSYSYRLKQVDYDGTFSFSEAIQVEVDFTVNEFALEQNYPNPFNPSTIINFSLAVDSKVSLKVFDVLGQEVANLVNTNLVAGSHNVDFNASLLNSGVYFYRIEATGIDGTNFTNVKKMILTK